MSPKPEDESLARLLRAILGRLDTSEETLRSIERANTDMRKIVVELSDRVGIFQERLFEQAERIGGDLKRVVRMTQETDAELQRLKQQLSSTSGTRPKPPRP